MINPSPSPNQSSPVAAAAPSSALGSVGGGDAVDRAAVDSQDAAVDFSFLEEEFQVQLALAISASDPDARDDRETAQIKVAKRISLGCSPSTTDTETLVELLSLRYWNYNAVNYDEKVMDGFYDVYGITANSVVQGKMPLLVDLQAISVLDNVDYEVILVDRMIDPDLRELEDKAYSLSMEYQVSDQLTILDGLVQKIADMVVERMGGPVGDADEMLKRWTIRSYELRSSLNTIILPLGRLDIGLSRHRALLFKVLADRINLPCLLVKGSYYTGTDDGAINLIKIDNGSEYIIDLMGAPGALIPAEVPSSHHQNFGLDVRSCTDVIEAARESLLVPEKGTGFSPNLDVVSKPGSSKLEEAPFIGIRSKGDDRSPVEKFETERFENEFGNLLPSLRKLCEGSSGTCGKASPAQKMKVKDVSKYVISAAKNPEFAQKLHAVLLESGASPPPDLFSDINCRGQVEQKVLEQIHMAKGKQVDHGVWYSPGEFLLNSEQPLMPSHQVETNVANSDFSLPSDTTSEGFILIGAGANGMIRANATGETCQRQPENALVSDGGPCFQDNIGRIFSNIGTEKESALGLMETANGALLIPSNAHSEQINPMLAEVAEWEIPWEDLQIGERIGIGSYGEVYRADWNGTEVAVKKFLAQDFSGDALVQFRYEVEIMLRLRHPNVVLFMGAVTRPPNLSILTEFLPRGSLYRLLHRSNIQLDEKRRLRMALDVAKGMNYLHTSHPTIVHRDLKSPNLLVDKNWVVKVCDFGLSRLKHHTFLSSKSTAGTPEWMAPEVLRNEPSNEKCDVYSFGVILWELATLRIPWSGMNPMQVVGAVGFQDRRLEIPEEVDPMVAQIINDCWEVEPRKRPSFSQLMSRLKHLQHLVFERASSSRQAQVQ